MVDAVVVKADVAFAAVGHYFVNHQGMKTGNAVFIRFGRDDNDVSDAKAALFFLLKRISCLF